MQLPPDDKGNISIPAQGSVAFNISMEGDTASSSISVGTQTFPLKHDLTSGLWTVSIPENTATATSRLAISASDESGNSFTGQPIGTLTVLNRGLVYTQSSDGVHTPVSGAHIRVLKFSEDTQSFAPFVGGNGAELTADTVTSGGYDLALPQGKYRLIVTASGMKTLEQEVTLALPGFVELPFVTEPVSGLSSWIQSIVDWFR